MAEQMYFTGAGKVYLSKINPSTSLPDAEGFRYVGNTDSAMISQSVSNMTHMESESGLEKEDFTLAKQLKATFELKLSKFNIANLQLSLFGTKTSNAGATVTSETVVAPSDLTNSVKLANFNITTFTSLTNSGASTTYVNGTDYKWSPSGILTFPTGTTITASQSLRANYVCGTSEAVNAFAAAQPRLWVMIEGLNLARNNSPVLIEAPLAVFDPLASWELISQGKTTVEQMDLKGKFLYVSALDVSPIGSGRIPGGFFKATQLVEV